MKLSVRNEGGGKGQWRFVGLEGSKRSRVQWGKNKGTGEVSPIFFKDGGGKRNVRYQQGFEDLWIWDGMTLHPYILNWGTSILLASNCFLKKYSLWPPPLAQLFLYFLTSAAAPSQAATISAGRSLPDA